MSDEEATQDAEDHLVHHKVAITTGLHTVSARRHAVEENRVKE